MNNSAVTSRIDVSAPATITVLAGTDTVSSLEILPPGGILVSDPNAAGTLTVQLIAANAGAVLSASGGGATVTAHGNTLSLTGGVAQVNAALAALLLTEPAGASTDTIRVLASDPAALSASTAIAVDVAANGKPGFAAPPTSLALAGNTLSHIAGLDVGDPGASGDALAGDGAAQTLALTLAAASGLLFLPGYTGLDGIEASGLGTGTIQLDFTADRLSAADSLLAGLEIAAPAASSGLAYSLRDASDPDRLSVTNGNIALNIAGAGANGGFAVGGGQSLILGQQSLSTAQSLTIAATTGDLGGIQGSGALTIAPDAAFNLPYNGLTLGGSSFDFGTLAAHNFAEAGAIVIAEGATFAQSLSFGATALADFAGNLVGGNSAQSLDQLSITLQSGATLTGDGTILAGNFSESGVITGAGTILANGGDTLTIDAGSIGGGAMVEAAPGGVVLLGPDDALYGVFADTPLTVDSSVLLSFTGAPGLDPVVGGFADSLDSSGGVFVIAGPQVFNGTIAGFAPGDRLIFPGLTNVSLYNISSASFNVGGTDKQGNTVTYLIDAAHPAGTSPFASTDAAGDTEIGLRASSVDIFLGGSTIAVANINATSGVAQPIQGLDVLPTATTTLSFTVTLAVAHGLLTDGAQGPAATLTISAANPTALNNSLAGLAYTGTGVADVLTISAGSGPLAGLSATAHINAAAAATLSNFGLAPTAADTVSFASASPLPDVIAAAPGEVIVAANADFADALTLSGLTAGGLPGGGVGGTALAVDGGAVAVFDAAASVSANANVVVGDGGGAGTLAVLTDHFSIAGANLIIGGAGAYNGDLAYVTGSIGIGGALGVGAGASAALDLDGSLTAAAASIATAGTILAYDGATAAFGSLADAGLLTLTDQAAASASTIALNGRLSLGGTSQLTDSGGIAVAAGAAAQIGPDAALDAAAYSQTGGAVTVAGTLAVSAAVSVSGGGVLAIAGGTIDAATITLGAGGTLAGQGIVTASGGIALAGGTITASGGTLTLGGNIAGTGTIGIGISAALDIVHGLGGGTIGFSGTGAALIVNDIGVFTAAVTGFTGHDVIDLVGVAPSLVGTASGSITATDSAGNKLGGFGLSTVAGQPAIAIVSDSHGGALVTLGDEMPCFARGTRLLTPAGYRPVEALQPGDALITAAGDRRPIVWIGTRTVDFARPGAASALPVLFTPNALGPGRPGRPVRLSPLHAVAIDGALVPAGHLVNGATILRETGRAAVTYLHVELDRHDVILADGLPCETYLDTGNRGALYRETGRRAPAQRRCAPLLTGGAALAGIRRRLHRHALAAGFALTYRPALRALANDQTAMPEIEMQQGRRVARFKLPRQAQRITLLAPGVSPADTDPDSEDRRQLTVCLEAARAGASGIPRLGAGWFARGAGDAGTWMGPSSELFLRRPAASLTLTLAAVVQSWQPPPNDASTLRDRIASRR